MKLFYIAVLRNSPKPAQELVKASDLSSFGLFNRGTVGEFMTYIAGTIAERTAPGTRQDVQEKSYIVHVYSRTEGIAAVVISDFEYPKLVAHKLLSQIVDDFLTAHPRNKWATGTPNPPLEMKQLQEYITKYQDPQQADSILRIQKELDETKIVLHKTIESVLERGERLDTLVEKSDNLSSQSKMFYKAAQKQNSCCVVM